MKKYIHHLLAIALGFRGTVMFASTINENPPFIRCSTCGKKWDYTVENAGKYQFGHVNCPDVLVRPVLRFERYQ